jgi:hypothetical protein
MQDFATVNLVTTIPITTVGQENGFTLGLQVTKCKCSEAVWPWELLLFFE